MQLLVELAAITETTNGDGGRKISRSSECVGDFAVIGIVESILNAEPMELTTLAIIK